MDQKIPDFSDDQLNAIQKLVDSRYGVGTELELGDSEVQLDPGTEVMTLCPVIFWNARECNFMVIRASENQYRARYFYNPLDQFDTRQIQFTDVEDCVLAVLREQADHEREASMVKDDAAANNIN